MGWCGLARVVGRVCASGGWGYPPNPLFLGSHPKPRGAQQVRGSHQKATWQAKGGVDDTVLGRARRRCQVVRADQEAGSLFVFYTEQMRDAKELRGAPQTNKGQRQSRRELGRMGVLRPERGPKSCRQTLSPSSGPKAPSSCSARPSAMLPPSTSCPQPLGPQSSLVSFHIGHRAELQFSN